MDKQFTTGNEIFYCSLMWVEQINYKTFHSRYDFCFICSFWNGQIQAAVPASCAGLSTTWTHTFAFRDERCFQDHEFISPLSLLSFFFVSS